jgi:hypothetical protein
MSSVTVASRDVGLFGQYHVDAVWEKGEGFILSVYDRRDSREGGFARPISRRWYANEPKLLQAFKRKVKQLGTTRENPKSKLQVKNPALLADQLDLFQRGYLAEFLKPNERVYLKKIQAKLRADQPLTKGELEFLGDAMSILMRKEMGVIPEMVGPMGYAKMRANPRERTTATIHRVGRVRSEYQTFPVWFSEEGEGARPAMFDVSFLNRPEMRVGNRIEFEFATTNRGWRIVRADFQLSPSGPLPPQQTTWTHSEFTTGYVTKLKGEEEGDQPYRMAWGPRGAPLNGTVQGINGLIIPEDVIDSFNASRTQNGLPKILPSYGRIIADGSQRVEQGRIFFIVTHIHDFLPETQERVVVAPLSGLEYQLNSVGFNHEGQQGYININLPFDSHPTLNTLKQHFTGNVTVRGQFKKEGFWDRGGEHNYWFYLGNMAEWSETSLDDLRRVVRAHRETEEVRRIINEYYARGQTINMEEFAGQLSSALGRSVTAQQAARDYLPHTDTQRQEYEWEYIDAIKDFSDHMGGQYLYIPHRTSPEFVFAIGDFLILEIPVTNKASYIFKLDTAKGLEQQLADIRAVPQRSAIYLNENIGLALLYHTRVIHRTVPGWIDRIKAIVTNEERARENPIIVPPDMATMENPKDASADVTLARELALYASNTASISRNYIDPVVRNLAHKRVRRIFDRDKALQLISLGAKYIQKLYWKEMSGSDDPPEMNRATKLAFAEELYGEIEERIDEVTREILMGMRTRIGEPKPVGHENPVQIVTEEGQ